MGEGRDKEAHRGKTWDRPEDYHGGRYLLGKGAVAPMRYIRYVRRSINTHFFSLTMNIRDAARTEYTRRQEVDAIVEEWWIWHRRRACLPLDQFRLDQQLGKSLDSDFGETACRNLLNIAHYTPIARSAEFQGSWPE